MKAKVISNLKTMQQSAAEIVASGYLETGDDMEVRYLLYKLPAIIERLEKRDITLSGVKPREIELPHDKGHWDNCDGL